jgi:putative ABC transport system permease protein
MSMLTFDRPDRGPDRVREPVDPTRTAAARRALFRWGLRLLRREWKQRVIIVVLIAMATAVMILGTNVASATPGRPNAGLYGTSSTLVILNGNTPHLAAEIGQLTKAYGPASVVYDQTLPTGIAGGADLRAQDPNAPYTKLLLALDSGGYPTRAGQVAVTAGLAQLYGLKIGDAWQLPGSGGTRTVTGIVEDPSNLNDEFALVAPGQLASPTQVRIFLGVSALSAAVSNGGDIIPASASVSYPRGQSAGITPAAVVLIVSVLGLVFIGLIASAAFTVMAQRRQRALGMLSSLGATEGDVRFVLILDGAIAGLLGAVIGSAIGFAGWFWYYPHLEIATAHRIDPLSLSWATLIIGVVLAIATAVIAAARPGRAVSRVPIVAAISGRIPPPQRISRSIRRGLIWGAAGLMALFASGGWGGGSSGAVRLLLPVGLIACVVSCSLLAPFFVDMLARLAARAPLATRLALRDLDRYRSRSGAALAAVSFAIFLAVIVTIIASVRFDDALDYAAPNLTGSQLILYAPGNDPAQHQPGQFTPAAKLAATRQQADVIAAQMQAPAPLELDMAISPNVVEQGSPALNQSAWIVTFGGGGGGGGGGFSGQVFVATPALLKAYGISQAEVNQKADLLTMRAGLADAGNLGLVSGSYLGLPPNAPLCPVRECIPNPVIQTISALPPGEHAPNTVITERAVKALGLRTVPVGWLIQSTAALTAPRVNAARQDALALGTTIETKSGQLSLGQISEYATIGGLVIALGVLALTVGLIRGETAVDLRTLTAAGASVRVRRALTGVTAGALALLGAVLGAVAACLASLAFAHSSLTTTFGNVPWTNLALLVIGMPLIAAAAGWLLGGREPAGVARQPLE